MRGNDQSEAARMGQPLTPVEVIRERLEYLREQKARVAKFITGRPDLTTIESPIDGEIAGLEFALRALGVEL